MWSKCKEKVPCTGCIRSFKVVWDLCDQGGVRVGFSTQNVQTNVLPDVQPNVQTGVQHEIVLPARPPSGSSRLDRRDVLKKRYPHRARHALQANMKKESSE